MKRSWAEVFFATVFFVSPALLQGQSALVTSALWQEVPESSLQGMRFPAGEGKILRGPTPQQFRAFTMDRVALSAVLARAPREFTQTMEQANVRIDLPLPEGGIGKFLVLESPIMDSELAAKFPQIKTYVVQGLDDPTATGRLDWTPAGFRGSILSSKGRFFIDPYWQNSDAGSIAYYTSQAGSSKDFQCGVQVSSQRSLRAERTSSARPTGTTLRIYRLALAATGEYTAAVSGTTPGTVGQALAAMVTTVNRVNSVYERDFAIRLNLINATTNLIYTNAATDPYLGNNMNTENQANVDAVIGNSNYDIGHVVSTGGGGYAGLGVVCKTGRKAEGYTGMDSPVGDAFDIDYVAHEMGHQFGGNHTFNALANLQWNYDTAFEPGSGSTIMAYAGVVSGQNLQLNSDDHFHVVSYDEIDAYTSVAPGNGAFSNRPTGNLPPIISPLPINPIYIPAQTPFALGVSASDPNGDILTYCWEECDKGPKQDPMVSPRDNGSSPIFRSYSPSTNPIRIFPSLKYILANSNLPPATYTSNGATYITGEFLPTTSRTMNFRVTVRDNAAGGGGVNWASMRVASVAAAGPFSITNFNNPEILTVNRSATLRWNVAGTGPGTLINCSQVKISLSTDGGTNFSRILATNASNNGAFNFVVPNAVTSQARFKVEAVGNIFFDINNTNISIVAASGPANDFFNSPLVLGAPPFSTSGSVGGATAEAGEQSMAGIKPTRSVWFQWTAPSSGLLLLTSTGTSFAHALGVYSGTPGQIISLRLLAARNFSTNDTNRLEIPVVSGAVYSIKLDGLLSTNTNYTLAGFLRRVPAPAQLRFVVGSTSNRPISPEISWSAVTNADVTHYQVEILQNSNLLRGISVKAPATNWNNGPALPRTNGLVARVRAFSTNLASDWTTAPAVFP